MKKKLITGALILFVLSGCGVFAPSPQEQVANAVRQTLTAVSIRKTQSGIIINNFRDATPSAETLTPTLTTQLPQVAFTDYETIQNEYINVMIDEQFQKDASAFGISGRQMNDETIQIQLVQDGLILRPKMSNGWRTWRLRPPVFSNGLVEMRFSFLSCTQDDRFGIIVRSENYQDGMGYYLSVSCNGTIAFTKNAQAEKLFDARQAFKSESNADNRLSVLLNEKQITIFLNEIFIGTIEDEEYKSGFAGFFTQPASSGTLTTLIRGFWVYEK